MRVISKRINHFFFALLVFLLAGAMFFNISSSVPDSICISTEDDAHLCSMPHISITLSGNEPQSSATAKLWGVIPVKKLCVSQVAEREVILGGTSFGIKLFTKGVVIVETGSVLSSAGLTNPGKSAGLVSGDIIERIDGVPVSSVGDVTQTVKNSDGRELSLTVSRDSQQVELSIAPVYSTSDGCYKAGLWVRDSFAGIGMLTFIDPETMTFGGLGHAVCDYDSGCVLPVASGEITGASIIGITAGSSGVPGEMLGYLSGGALGELKKNSRNGVFGVYTAPLPEGRRCKIGLKQSVEEGKAQMLLTMPGSTEPELYDIVIEKIQYDVDVESRNMIIRVTDQRLLDSAGGIVQGMSGAPILQGGRLVGAVTHVFVNDPTRGYGIFVENMLEAAG